jgi:hypothetical protein
MNDEKIAAARRDIESTENMLERALKLAGLVTSIFGEHGYPLVVVGGSAVEFYTEGGYMSGDIDFCRRSLQAIPPRLAVDLMKKLGGESLGRNWLVCGLYVDMLGLLENESIYPYRELETPYGVVRVLPPEIALVERILYAESSSGCVASARQMMAAALHDAKFDWAEAERLADLPDFKVLSTLAKLKAEMGDAKRGS